MNKIEKNKTLSIYYQLYHKLLSGQQLEIYQMYYFEDYSINEIATLENVSKNAIYNTLNRIEDNFYLWEQKLHLVQGYKFLKNKLRENNMDLDVILMNLEDDYE